ncbi:hypothetical protein [Sandarakinorhabdus sp.]|uniref:bestrophin-like domain n=1 Tax=Sandarakinorhabdus sp. TaxID=1916663 RepID=UPI00286D8FBD|nr:hypothetical protein [Sandarakinorhabdus sp.]
MISHLAAQLDALPLTAIGLLLAGSFLLASELGFWAHHRLARGGDGDQDEGQVLSTALLLLALLLGFTFSMALGRFDERRALVVQESNDIGTAWLRAGLVETPAGAALQDRLAAYARTRVGSPSPDQAERLRAGARLRGEIWQMAAAATAPDRSTAQATALIASVNAVLDTATTREKAVAARVPGEVLVLLVLYSQVASFLLGYVFEASGQRHRLASGVLFALLAMTIVLILDLDRPQGGSIRIDQRAMTDLVASLAPQVE